MDDLGLIAAVNFAAAEKGKKRRRFSIVAYTGGPLQQGHMGWDYPIVVDLAGLDVGGGKFPILDAHGPAWFDHKPMREYVVGQADSADTGGGRLTVEGRMILVNESARHIVALADDGFGWQASIGARCLEKEFHDKDSTVEVNGQTFQGPIYVSRKTKLREVSFVVLGADDQTSALVAALGRRGAMGFTAFVVGKGLNPADLSAEQKSALMVEYKGALPKIKAAKKCESDEEMEEEEDDRDEEAEEEEEDEEDEEDERPKKGKDAKAGAGKSGKGGLNEFRAEMARETGRIQAIGSICAQAPGLTIDVKGKKVSLAEHAIAAKWSPERTRQRLELEQLRANRPAASGSAGPYFFSPSAPMLNEAVLECAVLQAGGCQLENDSFYFDRGKKGEPERRVPEAVQRKTQREMRARYTDQVQQQAHDLWRGRVGLHQLLTAAASANGYRGSEVISVTNLPEVLRFAFRGLDVRADGGSTVSIQNVLANVMNKYLLAGYLNVDQSWREIVATRPVKDFKPTKSINLTGDFLFRKLNGDGQIQHGALTDEPYPNQIDTFARMLSLSRQTIVNDDLSALTQVPMLMGIGAGDSLSILVWTLFLNPPVWPAASGGDGNAFFFNRTVAANTLGGGAINSNIVPSGGSSALSSASLQTAVQLFDKQVKANGQPLGLNPEVLLYPPELDVAATELMNSEWLIYGGATAAKQPQKNVWQGRFKPVKSPYLSNSTYTGNSATGWYLLANPQRLAVIEIAFLNGQEAPTVQTAQADFNELGIQVRGFYDAGVAMQNPRAGVKSPGA